MVCQLQNGYGDMDGRLEKLVFVFALLLGLSCLGATPSQALTASDGSESVSNTQPSAQTGPGEQGPLKIPVLPFRPADPNDPAAIPQNRPDVTLDQLRLSRPEIPPQTDSSPSSPLSGRGTSARKATELATPSVGPVQRSELSSQTQSQAQSTAAPPAPAAGPAPAPAFAPAPGPPPEVVALPSDSPPPNPNAPMPQDSPVLVQDIQTGSPPASATHAAGAGAAGGADNADAERVLHHYWLFFGADAGYAGLDSQVPGEVFRQGDQYGLKVLGSYYFDSPWVLDFGGGWERTQVQSRVDYSTSLYSYQEVAGLITRSGFAELDTRYRFGDHIQLGPYVGMMFGTDLSFSPAFNPASDTSPFLVGGQFFYELTNDQDSWATRLGARASTTMSVPDRQLFALQLSIQFGLPLDSGSKPLPPPVIESPPPVQPQPQPQPQPVAAPPPALVQYAAPAPPAPRQASAADTVIVKAAVMSVEMTLGSNFVNFATGKSNITPEFAAYLDQFSQALNETRDSWKTLVVIGHTDIRGTHHYNMNLSARRATIVAHALILRGVSAERINTEHYGPDRPLDPHNNPEAWALNRRVEIRILGVNDSEKLAARLRQLTPIGPSGAPDPAAAPIQITAVKSVIMTSHGLPHKRGHKALSHPRLRHARHLLRHKPRWKRRHGIRHVKKARKRHEKATQSASGAPLTVMETPSDESSSRK